MALRSGAAALRAARSLLHIPSCTTASATQSSSGAAWFSSASNIPTSPVPTANDQHSPGASAPVLNKLLYRARQRGFLELDLLVGRWAERELAGLQPDALHDFEVLLNQENPELFKWLTGQLPAPEELQRNRAFTMIRSEVEGRMAGGGTLAAAAAPGAEWVRGWDDAGKAGSPST